MWKHGGGRVGKGQGAYFRPWISRSPHHCLGTSGKDTSDGPRNTMVCWLPFFKDVKQEAEAPDSSGPSAPGWSLDSKLRKSLGLKAESGEYPGFTRGTGQGAELVPGPLLWHCALCLLWFLSQRMEDSAALKKLKVE